MKPKEFNTFLIILIINLIDNVIGTHVWHPYTFGTGYGNRQELKITNITTDVEFKYGEGVTKWTTINVNKKTYAIGMMKSGVTVLTAEYNETTNKFDIKHKVNALDRKPADIVLYKEFSLSKKLEIIVIIPSNENKPTVEWYKINNLKLVKIWSLDFHFNIVHVNYMQILNNHLLVLINNQYENATVVQLYFFDLPKKSIWFLQLLRLSVTTDSTNFMRFGVNYYLAIPQKLKNSVLLYVFNEGQFISYRNITGISSTQVISFRGGYGNFIAVNGNKSEIYELAKYGLRGAELTFSLKDVEYFLEIPATPYGDEPILFAQRLVNHTSHHSHSIDVMLYHNGKFKMHEEMDCSYFGETSHGANCILENDQSSGLKGAAVIGDGIHIGLLVPRKSGASILIMINYIMKDLPDPVDVEIEKLEITKELIEEAIAKKKANFAKEKNRPPSMNLEKDEKVGDRVDSLFRQNGRFTWIENESYLQEANNQLDIINDDIENLKNKLDEITSATNKKPVDSLTVNGKVKIEGKTIVQNLQLVSINGHQIKDVFEDSVNLLNLKPINSEKTFTNLKIDRINVDSVNGKRFDDVAMKSDNSLRIKGNLSLDKLTTVEGDVTLESGLVNNIAISDEIVKAGTNCDTVHFENVHILNEINSEEINGLAVDFKNINSENENIEEDSLDIDGKVTVININGQPLQDFLDSLCFTNANTYIPGNFTVNGSITVSDNAYTTVLNGLPFKTGYLFKNSDSFTNITGRKTFSDTIYANEIITSGLLNNVNLNNVVTLNNNQTIPGNFRFNDLEITESIYVNGNLTGSKISKLQPKDTLFQSHDIYSNVNFQDVEVDGTVTISRNFNGKSFEDILKNVVYKDVDDGQVIESVKEFRNGLTIRENLFLTSNTVNTIPLDSFITKDTEQQLNLGVLNGIVTIENLQLDGDFNGINITKLDQDSVKLTGEQYISSNLHFNNEIETKDLKVLENINGVPVESYGFSSGDVHYNSLNLNKVYVNNLEILENFDSDNINFDLKRYDSSRLSKTKDQIIDANFLIDECNVKKLKSQFINNIPYNKIFGTKYLDQLIVKKINNNELAIDELNVDGTLFVEYINDIKVEEMSNSKCPKEITFQSDMIFYDDIYFENLTIEEFNGINFDEFVSNIVYKNETSLTLNMKTYLNGFQANNIYTDHLNAINKNDILTKYKQQEISAPLVIHGDVLINGETHINENLNDISMKLLHQNFEVTDNGYKINDDVMFNRLAYVDSFNVNGYINDKNFTDIYENLVSIHDDQQILNDVTFRGPVTVTENLSVRNELNGINLNILMKDIVYINKFEYIEGLVTFTGLVNVTKCLDLDTDFYTRYVMGIDLEEWKQNAVLVNVGLIPGNITFETAVVQDSIQTQFLNGINTASFIPLRSYQNITTDIYVNVMSSFHDIDVKNLVNQHKLQYEFENTLLNETQQVINSPLIFTGNVVVRDFLTVKGLINNMDINKIVTTSTNQNLTALYNFAHHTTINDNLVVFGLVNGVNVTYWDAKTFKHNNNGPINVENVWTVEKNITFDGNVYGNSLIGGLNVTNLADVVEKKRSFKTKLEKNLIKNYNVMCNDIDYLLSVAKKQIYSYKYLEYLQHLEFDHKVENVHNFEFKYNHFMLINEYDSCNGSLFVWNYYKYTPLKVIETGTIEQAITVIENDQVFLVTRSNLLNSKCLINGTNIWRINDNFNLEWLYKIDDQYLLQDSLLPGTFYALNKEQILEYRLHADIDTLRKNRKWILQDDTTNMAFIPRGLKLGPTLRNGQNIYKLKKEIEQENSNLSYETDLTALGYVIKENNYVLPGKFDGEVIVMKVGLHGNKQLVGVIQYEDVKIHQHSDLIMIYEDIAEGKLFTKINAYKPSSLTTLQFDNNGETLLLFLEDNKMLQIYEYKGLEGFKHIHSAVVEGTKLFTTKLPMKKYKQSRSVVGAINENTIILFEAVMDGQEMNINDLRCNL